MIGMVYQFRVVFVKLAFLKGKEDMDIREQELRVFEEPPNPTSLL